MRTRTFLIILIFFFTYLHADEGMWMLPDIGPLNIEQMQALGCQLNAEDIYHADKTSMKDAIIVFGGGCTGVVVSKQGLIFTNHHCGYAAIQQLSTVKDNYLKNGFTAKNIADELPVAGLTVKFLKSITDVTDRVLESLPDSMSFDERANQQEEILNTIKEEFQKDNDYIVQVKTFHNENAFYVFVMEEFKDIRLAYTPPSSIGKFGGDTDNWMWPRHTGDFSVFRIYADSLNQAAEYAESNQPYIPKKVIPTALSGYQEHDFAMILGNPGTTTRYLSSQGIYNRVHAINRARIDVRGEKQAVWQTFMKDDEAINIAYANKYAGSSNYWKNSIGMNRAVERLNILARKKTFEELFLQKLSQSAFQEKYAGVVEALNSNYQKVFPIQHASSYLREALVFGFELPHIANHIQSLLAGDMPTDSLLMEIEEVYKNYYWEVDKSNLAVMLKTYRNYVEPAYLPEVYKLIDKKYKGDYQKYADHLFKKTVCKDFESFTKHLTVNKTKIKSDPAILFSHEIEEFLSDLLKGDYAISMDSIRHLNRLFEAGIKDLQLIADNQLYPDANFTMRMTYGTISGYHPADAVTYDYYTTPSGILGKEIPNDREFHVPETLKASIQAADYGDYADKSTGELFVNFLCNTDITGGNSGSPVFNAKGELLGLAFDGNWEAMSGDLIFEPELQRTIAVDVRYMLYVMDKIGDADRLLKELELVR